MAHLKHCGGVLDVDRCAVPSGAAKRVLAGFVAFSLPVPLVLNFLFLIYWALRRSWLLVLPFAGLILGWTYYARLFAINLGQEIPKEAKTLQVLSFNTHIFNAYDGKQRTASGVSEEMVDWIATHPADVFCLQEFYNNRNTGGYNTAKRIGVRHNKEMYFSIGEFGRKYGDIGIAIFSKHPIIDKGAIHFTKKESINRGVWADIVLEGDTIRIYAVHLQSMSIRAADIENTYSAIGNEESFKKESRNLARRLKRGFIARAVQVEQLLEHVRKSPYPVIVCGDFNDIPFSYTYNQLAAELQNSFVQAGNGIGSTYNGILPFLRIDNQFHSEGLKAYNYETHYEMGLSDHFPISATYVLEPKPEEER
ncbi:endonuclease/exonuclease/phosphatase family protein [Pontibacter rugosus]